MFNELTKAQYDNAMKSPENRKFPPIDNKSGEYSHEFSPDQQVPKQQLTPPDGERIKQEPNTPPPPLTSPSAIKLPCPPMLNDLSPSHFFSGDLSPSKFPEMSQKFPDMGGKFPEQLSNGFAHHDQPLDFSTKLKDEFYTTTNAPVDPSKSPDMDVKSDSASSKDLGDGNFNCKHCHRPFKSQVNLERHVEKSHNPKSSKIFSCLLCPYTTRFYSNMYVHIRTHTGDKPYWCGACGASFSQGSSLKIHIISKHGGNKKFFILDRKLGKANLLRFWQRREASTVNKDNENDFKPDYKKFQGYPNAFPGMLNLPDGGTMPGMDKTENGVTPNGLPNGQQGFLSNHLPMNNIGNLFPNGMNMLNPMNPMSLNHLMGQNPLQPNPMMFGNNNLLLQQSLMNGLNLKNSAFFTKTTKFENGEGKETKSPGLAPPQAFFGDMKDPKFNLSQMAQSGNPLAGLLQNGKLSPNKLRFPDFSPSSMSGLGPFGHMGQLSNSIPTAMGNNLPSPGSSSGLHIPVPPLLYSQSMSTSPRGSQSSPRERSRSRSPSRSPNAQLSKGQLSPLNKSLDEEKESHESDKATNGSNYRVRERGELLASQSDARDSHEEPHTDSQHRDHDNRTNSPNGDSSQGESGSKYNGTNSTNGEYNQRSSTAAASNRQPGSDMSERKLRDLRRNVVKMLRMMVPDLEMDRNMNQESEDVDLLLKEVIWSTATEMEIHEDRML